ncbi:hypothetical protein BH23PSE2_BH23PSE2_00830 [soil metagenome]
MNGPSDRSLDASTQPAIDDLHPWLGLASFSEETRGYFYGREDEVGELARRVQRKLLTVLFGQSGLGKTSILRAGIVPRLREQGYCPVYVRIDYGPDAPAPPQQIRQAMTEATALAGNTASAAPMDDESLWEFLHHRDDVITDAEGKPLIPLLIFDQFEEIFTLAQGDAGGRERAARFVEGLAELVENRPSLALEARLEEDDEAIERFDFARSDYRVLITLREDYLAHLEGLKAQMPSITQNRMRLAPMTGHQALAAVTGPGGALVSDEVAEAIVRFVAGGAELAHAQVEPSLLSLICRELNDKRIAGGRNQITLDLLAGSHASILTDFYERALADQPEAVRGVVEDVLLTDSGYRENVAEERVLRAFNAAGAEPNTLALLVNRRLLRIEERLDVRRVELTHDVLCSVVSASRAQRQEREAHAVSARRLAEQQERERTTRSALVRTRAVAAVCAVLAVGAVGASLYAGSVSRSADQARSQAEGLLGYISEDFTRELNATGRRELVADLGKRTIDYYAGLPAIAKGSDTERNQAMAMVGYGTTLRYQGRLPEAARMLTSAIETLERRRSEGDDSEATAIALGRGLQGQRLVQFALQDYGQALAFSKRAAQVLQPWAIRPEASVVARHAYGQVMYALGYMQARIPSEQLAALESFTASKRAYASLGALDLTDLHASVGYGTATVLLLESLLKLGRYDEIRLKEAETRALMTRVLARNPNYLDAWLARGGVTSRLADAQAGDLQLEQSVQTQSLGIADIATLTRLDPGNTNYWFNLMQNQIRLGRTQAFLGRPAEAAARLQAALVALPPAAQGDQSVLATKALMATALAVLHADLGQDAAAEAAMVQARMAQKAALVDAAQDSFQHVVFACSVDGAEASVALIQGQHARAASLLQQVLVQLPAAKASGGADEDFRMSCADRLSGELGKALLEQREFAAAERALMLVLRKDRQGIAPDLLKQVQRGESAILLAIAQARLGRPDEARRTLAPTLKLLREQTENDEAAALVGLTLSSALYAQALSEPDQRPALLREAGALLAALPPQMQTLRSVDFWRERIARGAVAPVPAAGVSQAPAAQ